MKKSFWLTGMLLLMSLSFGRAAAVCDTISLTWTAEAGEEKNLYVGVDGYWSSGEKIYVDFGDGNRLYSEKAGLFTKIYEAAGSYEVKIATMIPAARIVSFNCNGTWDKNNGVTSLDVSHCDSLVDLDCGYNQLTSLGLSACSWLRSLNCDTNRLSVLDVSKNLALYSLACGGNRLTSLDVSKNLALGHFVCSGNQLVALDLSQNEKLSYFYASYNSREVYVDADRSMDLDTLPGMDVSRIGSVTGGYIEGMRLFFDADRVTYRYATGYSGNRDIESVEFVLVAAQPPVTPPDVPEKPTYTACDTITLTWMAGAGEKRNFVFEGTIGGLFAIDWGDGQDTVVIGEWNWVFNDNNNRREHQYAESGSYMVKLYGKSATDRIISFSCSSNQLTSLDVSGCTKLDSLRCTYNWLTSLDLPCDRPLFGMFCYGNSREVYVDADRSMDLDTLPGMDVSRIGSLRGGHIEGKRLFFDADRATYRYATGYSGNNRDFDSVEFTLVAAQSSVTPPDDPEEPTYTDCDTITLTWTAEAGKGKRFALEMGGNGNCHIDWGNGMVSDFVNLSDRKLIYNTYTVTGSYTVTIYSDVPITKLECSQANLTSLDISKNTALEVLWCRGNQLTSLDVTGCVALTNLQCGNNGLTSLDVSKNVKLEFLECSDNQLSSLDVSRNTALTSLYCERNRLMSLDVSRNTALTSLYCERNRLTSLDVSRNIALVKLECSDNRLTSLDVSQNVALTELSCWSNQLTSLDVSRNIVLVKLECGDNRLTSLDVSQNVALLRLNCSNNALSALDVSKNGKLESLNCDNNQLTSLDVSKNTALTGLGCCSNQLTSLDVSKNTALTELSCWSNQLTSLDVSQNTALERLDCQRNRMRLLDVTGCAELKLLYCNTNCLTALDVSGCMALETLSCGNNQLTSLDLNQNEALNSVLNDENFLEVLLDADDSFDMSVLPGMDVKRIAKVAGGRMEGTRLFFESDTIVAYEYEVLGDFTSVFHIASNRHLEQQIPLTAEFFPDSNFLRVVRTFDRDGNDSLCGHERLFVKSLDIRSHSITSLEGLQYFQNLEILDCSSNALIALDMSQNPVLRDLYCYNNQLTSLDVSKNTALTVLLCHFNQLTSLDISKNVKLNSLQCNDNHLSSLDVSKNTVLTTVWCMDNHLKLSNMGEINNYIVENMGDWVEYRNVWLGTQHIFDTVAMGDTLCALMPEMWLNEVATDIELDSIPSESYRFFEDGRLVFDELGTYDFSLTNESLCNHAFWSDFIEPVDTALVQVYYHVTVVDELVVDPDDPSNPDEPDTIVPGNGAGWIWLADAGEEKEIAFKGTGKGFRVDWGDSTTSEAKGAPGFDETSAAKDSDKKLEHRYAEEGVYTVTLKPLSESGRLTDLDVSDGRLVALRFGDASMLTDLDCSENLLTELDLSGAAKLKALDCSENLLPSLDLTACAQLQEADFSENRLTTVSLPTHSNLKAIDGKDNRLSLSGLYDLLSQRVKKASYGFDPQGDSVSVAAGDVLDLSSEMLLGGKSTAYTVYDADGRPASKADYTETGGQFRFTEAGRCYRLSLTNAAVMEYKDGNPQKPVTFVWNIIVSGVGNEELAGSDAGVYVRNRTICLSEDLGEMRVYTILGRCIYKGHGLEAEVPCAGLYVVQAGGHTWKVVVR